MEILIMSNWSYFEQSCAEYLNLTFGKYASFEAKGGSDSTVPDIKAITKKGGEFYIEVKDCPAQCGQFVLFPDYDTRSFKYSSNNVSQINSYSQAIISHMDNSFEQFHEAGTAGEEIIFENASAVFAAWIIQNYKNKDVCFIITNDNMILPVDDFGNFFNITATYRVKKSGSAKVGNRSIDAVEEFLRNNYHISKFSSKEGKLFISSKRNLHGECFAIGETEYMFSKRDSKYEIRRLSQTRNANVIFSIDLKKDVSGLSNQKFISFLI